MLRQSLLLLAALGLARAASFTNPIQNSGADPFIVYDHDTSSYYLTITTGSGLQLISAPTIDGLRTGGHRRQAYQNATMVRSPTVWASEIHKVDGSWYIYYSHGERPYALKGGATPNDPFPGPPVQLYDKFGIDGTVLVVSSTNYFVWSCFSIDASSVDTPGSSLCIAPLTTPTTIDKTKIAVISRPEEAWEENLGNINEAPQPLYWMGDTYLTFSASDCRSPEYSLGLLHLTGSDPLDPASWTKIKDGPVFSSGNGEYGPGHNGIFASPDGTELWNVYHAVTNPAGSCGPDRQTFVKKIDLSSFTSLGPIFGEPAANGLVAEGPSGEDAPSGNSSAVTATTNTTFSTALSSSSDLSSTQTTSANVLPEVTVSTNDTTVPALSSSSANSTDASSATATSSEAASVPLSTDAASEATPAPTLPGDNKESPLPPLTPTSIQSQTGSFAAPTPSDADTSPASSADGVSAIAAAASAQPTDVTPSNCKAKRSSRR
ncbi:hypothetical protein CI109_106047 [Kwoniella shandongensis]|uniref:Beta-xylosidase C-terminal Concanavalin A-like domain-containing protein n=1 Tax=Kwoniella shandongensis TaxID=1734106 RepID=A0AAJ8LQQ6_9TREE